MLINIDTHRPTTTTTSNDPFNLSKSPLKNFIKKPNNNSNQVNLYEFIQSRNESNGDKNFSSAFNNQIPNENINLRSKSELKKNQQNEKKRGCLTERNKNPKPKQRKNFLALNKKRLNELKNKSVNIQKKKQKKQIKTHKKSKSSIKDRRVSKETLYIPQQDHLSDIVRVAEKQQLRSKNSELVSQTDVYIENESEYDIINELKRDILIKDKANESSDVSPLPSWGQNTSPFDDSNMELINGTSKILYNV